MRFSIVIPSYNSGPVLERAILSLLGQRYPDLQIILADSESQDVSREIIAKYRELFDPLICEKDRGQADGLNKGFEHARGDVFGWLCADDVLLPGALEHVAELFRLQPETDIVVGACERLYPDGTLRVTPPPDPDAWSRIELRDTIEQPSTFWDAALHRHIGKLDTRFHLAFDWDFWCRMKRAGARLLTTDRVLSRYYFTGTNKSGNSGELHAREGLQVIRRHAPMGVALAGIYGLLYRHFDLHGCYDTPPACTPLRGSLFGLTMKTLRALIGEDLLYMYNLHFASCQQRNLKWWQ